MDSGQSFFHGYKHSPRDCSLTAAPEIDLREFLPLSLYRDWERGKIANEI